MAEFIGEEKLVSKGEIVFENKTDSSFDVGMGVVFHKSGIYEVSIVGNKTIVSEAGKSKTWPESAREYCAECDHIEMCRWYPYEGCEFRSLPSAQLEQTCRGCKHEPRCSHEEPCGSCANNYVNKYERGNNHETN